MLSHPAATIPEDNHMRDPEAVLAGTLALMTAYAQTCCARQAGLLAQKIVVNLASLAEHAPLNPNFRTVLLGLRGRWVHEVDELASLAGASVCTPASLPAEGLWHAAPERVQ